MGKLDGMVIWLCGVVTENDSQGAPATRLNRLCRDKGHTKHCKLPKSRIETPAVLTDKSYSRDRFLLLVPLLIVIPTRKTSHDFVALVGPAHLQKCVREFDCINFGGFYWAIFPHCALFCHMNSPFPTT